MYQLSLFSLCLVPRKLKEDSTCKGKALPMQYIHLKLLNMRSVTGHLHDQQSPDLSKDMFILWMK